MPLEFVRGCGRDILATVSQTLTAEFARGVSHAEPARLVHFAQLFPDDAILVTLSRQWSWSDFRALGAIKNALTHDFDAELRRARRSGSAWSSTCLDRTERGAAIRHECPSVAEACP